MPRFPTSLRDLAHEKVFAKALESLGVNWDKTFPVPKTDSSKMREVQELEKRNLHNQQWTFTNDKSGLAEIFNGESPFGDGEVEALDGLPEGFDIPQMPEAPQEYSPGLDKELKQKTESNSRQQQLFQKSSEDRDELLFPHVPHRLKYDAG